MPTRNRLPMASLTLDAFVFEELPKCKKHQKSERSGCVTSRSGYCSRSKRWTGDITLIRTADVSRPVNEKDLTLKEAEELLETWKLRGQG